MNIFELSFVLSILAGLVLGGVAGGKFGVIGIVLGILGGLIVGMACYALTLGLSYGLAKAGRSDVDCPRNRLLFVAWWFANAGSVSIMVLAPVATIILALLVKDMLQK